MRRNSRTLTAAGESGSANGDQPSTVERSSPMWDHTYVTSNLGHVWRCWGASAGGRQICSAVGNVGQAECLSQPGSQAGIVYGSSGVCHQTANRILFPARQLVSAAHGYRAS